MAHFTVEFVGQGNVHQRLIGVLSDARRTGGVTSAWSGISFCGAGLEGPILNRCEHRGESELQGMVDWSDRDGFDDMRARKIVRKVRQTSLVPSDVFGMIRLMTASVSRMRPFAMTKISPTFPPGNTSVRERQVRLLNSEPAGLFFLGRPILVRPLAVVGIGLPRQRRLRAAKPQGMPSCLSQGRPELSPVSIHFIEMDAEVPVCIIDGFGFVRALAKHSNGDTNIPARQLFNGWQVGEGLLHQLRFVVQNADGRKPQLRDSWPGILG